MPLTSPRLWIVATPLGNPGDLSPRAREILEELESGAGCGDSGAPSASPRADNPLAPTGQVSLMDLGGETGLKKLRMTDVNILSPIEALNLLAEMKQDLNG